MNTTKFSASTATDAGGAIYQDSVSGIGIANSTVTSNRAPAASGGGIYDDEGTVTLNNTIVQGNRLNNCSTAASVVGCTG